MMNRDIKNKQIKETMNATRKKHAGMVCRVFDVKVVKNKLSRHKSELINTMYREAKWLRNSELSKGDMDQFDRNAKTAIVKIGDHFEERELALLGSQIKQDIVDSIRSEIRGLATKKKHGEKVGRLKYKSYCNCIPLRQYGTTYRIDFDHNTIKIQGMGKYPFRVKGLRQIPADADIANAKLVRKSDGLHFFITTYTIPKEKTMQVLTSLRFCGIDFGIGHNLTLDDNSVYDICVPELKSVKIASRRLNKSYHRNGETKTRNHYKRILKLQKAYLKQNNVKKDLANKVLSELLRTYDYIAIQNEMIANWHKGLFGKQVQHSAMGFIKARLRSNPKVHVVERSYPSTQICPECGRNTPHLLNKREYDCQYCGYHHDSRDAKAAMSILTASLQNVSVEHRTKSPAEVASSVNTRSGFDKPSPMKQEAQAL